jgi:hypothetical protein
VSRENPRSPEWAEYYAQHPEVLASWGESNGRQPPAELCPKTGRSASVCDTPDHRNCPDLDWRI